MDEQNNNNKNPIKADEVIFLAGGKKTEERLLASEIRYRRLFEAAKDGILILDAETGSVDDVNPFLTELLGYSRENILKKKVWDLGFFKDIAANQANFLQLQEKGYVRYEDMPLETTDGRRINVEFVSNVYFIDGKKVIQCNIRDITSRKKAEEELKKNGQKIKNILRHITDCRYEFDKDWNIIEINDNALRYFQKPREELIGKNYWELFPQAIGTIFEENYKKVASGKLPITFEAQSLIQDVWVELHAYPNEEGISVYFRDITERKQAEESLKKLNRTMRALSNSNQFLARAKDETSFLQDICRIVIEDCGYKMVWIGYANDDEKKTIKPVSYAGFEEGYLETLNVTWSDESRGRGPSGTAVRTGQVSKCENMLSDPNFTPWRDEAQKRGYKSSIAIPLIDNGKAFGALTIYSTEINPFTPEEIKLLEELASDVSFGISALRAKQMQAETEAELQRSEAKLRVEKEILDNIMNNAKTSLAYLDRDFNFIAVNLAFSTSNGRAEEELIGKNYFDFFPSEENKLLFERIRETGQQIEIKEKPLILKKQPWLDITYWDWSLIPVKNQDGFVYGLVISLADVSQHVWLENELKLHSRKAEQVAAELRKVQIALENASDIIFITNEKGVIIYANRAVKNILGYNQKELIGKKPNFWMEDMPNKFFAQMWNAIYFEKKPFIGEIRDRKKNGDVFVAEIKIAPVLDKNGQILSFVGIERDITEIKRLDLAKTEFISLAAHQLRTPITSVNLTAEMLLGGLAGKMNRESEEYLKEIMQGVQRMSEMIELFLNVSRIEMKTFEIIPRPTNISQIIEENIKTITPQCRNKSLELIKNIPDDLPIINADPKVINIALDNLLSNAIKYTPEKGVIGVEAERYRENIVIKVSDTGYGIPKKQQSKVFDKLFRADNVSEKAEGVGLGLYLTKSLIEQSGGNMWLKSERNKGSIFYISIPLNGMRKNKKS